MANYHILVSDLGVATAQSNAMYVYDKLRRKYCTGSSFAHQLNESDVAAIVARTDTNKPTSDACNSYFDRMTARRMVQLANGGSAEAKRQLADRLASGDAIFETDVRLAAKLYIEAAEAGNAAAFLGLGWTSFYGGSGIECNKSNAQAMFLKALHLDSTDRSMQSTQGLAPTLALIASWLLRLKEWCLRDGDRSAFFEVLILAALGVLGLAVLGLLKKRRTDSPTLNIYLAPIQEE
jgi:hypothetical protein